MGSISSLSNYLANLLSSSGSGSSSTASTASALQALQKKAAASSSGSGNSLGSSSYTLSLSTAAQKILNDAVNGASSGRGSSVSTPFNLPSAQQTTIKNIINKYKDAPFTEATFTQMQKDLQTAGLSPQTLAAKDEITSFNPTSVLLGDLSGNYTNTKPSTLLANEKTKQNNYLEDIVKLWQSVSTTAKTTTTTTSSGSGTSSGSSKSS